MKGCRAPTQKRQPVPLRIRDHVAKLLTNQIGALEIVMLANQMVPACFLLTGDQLHLEFLQNLFLVLFRRAMSFWHSLIEKHLGPNVPPNRALALPYLARPTGLMHPCPRFSRAGPGPADFLRLANRSFSTKPSLVL